MAKMALISVGVSDDSLAKMALKAVVTEAMRLALSVSPRLVAASLRSSPMIVVILDGVTAVPGGS